MSGLLALQWNKVKSEKSVEEELSWAKWLAELNRELDYYQEFLHVRVTTETSTQLLVLSAAST